MAWPATQSAIGSDGETNVVLPAFSLGSKYLCTLKYPGGAISDFLVL